MKDKKKLSSVITVLCILVIVACVGYIGWHYWSQNQKEKANEQLKEAVTITETVTPTPEETPTPVEEIPTEEVTPTEEPVVIPIDFNALQATNSDIYAWIEIPGTEVAYPILQNAADDSYYLMRNVDGSEGYPGCIYTETANAKDFTNFNTILYGHDMKDGSMFGTLKSYQDETYFKEHQEIIVYTPEKKYTYRIFAAVVHSDVHILYEYQNFLSTENRQSYLDMIYSSQDIRNTFDLEVPVTAESRILTLSTCIASQSDKRFLVEAVLVDE